VLQRPTAELLARGLGALGRDRASGDDDPLVALAAGYEALVTRARHAGALLSGKEVFVLENLTVLRRLAGRVAIEQMLEAGGQLDRALPRRPRHAPRRRGSTATRVEEEGAYPTGGFTAISTSGSIESLVSSELVYMEDGDEIDLFDVRYAEGELLFYTRDESVHVRQRRAIHFLLDPSLERARVKDPALPWQHLVLLFGLLYTAVTRLTDWLSADALTLHLVFVGRGSSARPPDPGGAAPSPLASEADLARLLLREWIEKEIVEISELDRDAALTLIGERSRRADCSLVAVGEAAQPRLTLPPGVHGLVLQLAEGGPRLGRWPAAAARDDEQTPWERWVEAGKALLEELV